MLGVARRTVATWHERPSVVIRPELQRALDTAYIRAVETDKIRFVRRLRADDQTEVGDGPEAGAALAVAICVVVRDQEVLLVCRRDSEPSGITWQFPAAWSSQELTRRRLRSERLSLRPVFTARSSALLAADYIHCPRCTATTSSAGTSLGMY
jgi:hypothetical protein